MTQLEVVAAIISAAVVVASGVVMHLWRVVQVRRTDNWVTVNREGLSTQRNIVRDAARGQEIP